MEENNPLVQLPTDILVQNILQSQFQGERPEMAFCNIINVDTFLKKICNSRQVRCNINLNKHLVFDSTKPIRYVQFILDCADHGNKRACLLYGLSMAFCFGQPNEGMKYLATIRSDYNAAEYACGILKIEQKKSRFEGIAILKRLKSNPTEDYIHVCRLQLLQLLNPGLHFNTRLKELQYNCIRGATCGRHSHSDTVNLDGQPIELLCSDKNYASIE